MPAGSSKRRLFMSAVVLGGAYAAVKTGKSARLDDLAYRVRRPLGHTADRIAGATTDLGSVYGIAGASTVLALTGRRDLAVDIAGAGATAWVVAQGLKPLLPRDRPYQAMEAARLVAEPAGTSWPSGHSAVSAAMGSVIADRTANVRGALAGAGLAGYVGMSRMYVGVHHATDVLAGWGTGVLSAWIWQLIRRGRRRLVGDR